jgi:hypothetical protein
LGGKLTVSVERHVAEIADMRKIREKIRVGKNPEKQ